MYGYYDYGCTNYQKADITPYPVMIPSARRKPRRPRSPYVSVADALGLYNNRLWYPIYGFKGYEMSNDGYIRSLKLIKQYPYGILIKPLKNNRNMYRLIDDEGHARNMRVDELVQLATNNPLSKPHKTNEVSSGARNSNRFFHYQDPTIPAEALADHIESNHGGMFTITPSPTPQYTKVQFTVVPDNTKRVECPIYDITGGNRYYGR